MFERYYSGIKGRNQIGKTIETHGKSEVICPWCSETYEKEDDYSLFEEGNHTCRCDSCGKDFKVETEISYTFSTTREVDDARQIFV